QGADRRRSARFLACWIALPFLFFSLSAGKRGLYLLPILPALALATAAGIASFWDRPPLADRRWIAGLTGIAAAHAALFLVAGPLVLDAHKSPRPIAQGVRARMEAGDTVGVYRLGPLEPALGYYGAGPITSLRDERALRRFLADARGPVLLRAADFEALGASLDAQASRRFRAGDRALALIRPSDPGSHGDSLARVRASPQMGSR
ncbi:MAG: hypothetical protein AAGC67_11025, partial [Myxococcota bacterium]